MRYIVAFLIGIGLIVLLFVWIFHGSSSQSQTTNKPRLTSYANTSTVVQYLDDYQINAQQDHRQVVITVGQDQITFSVLGGYENQVLRTQTYTNTQAGYSAFLAALQVEGFTNTDSKKPQDERGFCPEGHRYIFTLSNGSNTIERAWSTSCGNIGSFKGNTATIRDLFTKQVPDYFNLTSNIGLY